MFKKFSRTVSAGIQPVMQTQLRNYTPPTLASVGKSQNKGLRLVLLGAPGSGKGSFSKFISHHFEVPMISTGDLIRAEIKAGTPIGKQVEEITRKGHLVSDEIVISLLKQRISQPDTQNGYILDGFPRRVEQAEILDALSHTNPTSHTNPFVQPPNTVVNIELREDILITKACARRVCSGCGQGYNLADVHDGEYCMPAILPKVPNTCDSCGSNLIQRSDDVEETVRERLRVYHQHANPLLEYYNRRGMVLQWPVVRGLEDTKALLSMIDQSLVKNAAKNYF